MMYRKNIFAWEQVLRLVAGVAMVGVGAIGLAPQPWGLVLIAAGAVTAVTGAFGFCPACAMVGRRPIASREH